MPNTTEQDVNAKPHDEVPRYLAGERTRPLFLVGDSAEVMRQFPADSIDFCMTSPPYWGHRKYSTDGIGLEATWEEYLRNLLAVTAEVRRVLKSTGSFWLNLGDSYRSKGMVGIPWRVALAMIDEQAWILRNDVIWHKVKGGPDNSKDKLRNIHEYVFHFVKQPKGYHYDVDAIRSTPKKARVVNGAVVSATGVKGVRYRRQIELSTDLSTAEKGAANAALDTMLESIRRGEVADFRMVIRKQQRTTHSDSKRVSGRAREIAERGFYFLRYHPRGAKPADVWEIIPEDTQKRKSHFAPYPEDLCRIPLLATCPEGGVALDPFCGTGTTNRVAQSLGRRSIGIDVAPDYVDAAAQRCMDLF